MRGCSFRTFFSFGKWRGYLFFPLFWLFLSPLSLSLSRYTQPPRSIAFMGATVALITGLWISVAMVSTTRAQGLPWLSKWLVILFCIPVFSLALAAAVSRPFGIDLFRWYFLSVAILIFIMSMFVLVSGIRVLRANSSLTASGKNKERAERQARMASQVVLLVIVATLALAVLNILSFLPPSSFTTFDSYYFSSVFFPVVVQLIFFLVLMWCLRRTDLSSTKWRRAGSSASSKSSGDVQRASHSAYATPQVDAFAEDVMETGSSGTPGAPLSSNVSGWDNNQAAEQHLDL